MISPTNPSVEQLNPELEAAMFIYKSGAYELLIDWYCFACGVKYKHFETLNDVTKHILEEHGSGAAIPCINDNGRWFGKTAEQLGFKPIIVRQARQEEKRPGRGKRHRHSEDTMRRAIKGYRNQTKSLREYLDDYFGTAVGDYVSESSFYAWEKTFAAE